MDDEVRAIFDQARRNIDLMTPVVKASVRLYSCLCEFEDDEVDSACQEHADAWEQAVIDYKKATGR